MPTQITFTQTLHGSNVATIRAPAYPYAPRAQLPGTLKQQSHDGFVFTKRSLTSDREQMPLLTWDNLPYADYGDLYDFIRWRVFKSLYLFSYTDPAGTVHTNMRYCGGIEKFYRQSNGLWAGKLEIAKDYDA